MIYPIPPNRLDREQADRVRRLNLTGKLYDPRDMFDLAMRDIDAAFKAAFPKREVS